MPERQDYLRATIEHSRELLAEPGVIERLTTEEHEASSLFLDNLVPVELLEGGFTFDQEFDEDDKIPLIALRPGETATYYDNTYAASQIQSAIEFSKIHRPIGLRPEHFVDRLAARFRVDTTLDITEHASGKVVGSAWTDREPHLAFEQPLAQRVLRSFLRPCVVLQYQDEARHPQPTTLLHEGVHVRQRLGKGLEWAPQDADHEQLKLELEAYGLEYKILMGAQHRPDIAPHASARKYLNAIDIEEGRLALQSHTMEPTALMKIYLDKIGLLKRILREEII